ncbi:MAG TPA: ATP-binding protein, partial [Blastocatellia bacterium]
EISEGIPPIEGDSDQLQQVFINLINNSLDAMPAGGRLKVSTARDGDSVIIELSDTGEGILEESIDMIFNPLYSTKQGSGTGLGLTIVKQIISEHEGEVGVESEPGRGATFRIRLPLGLAVKAGAPGAALPLPEPPGMMGFETGGQPALVTKGPATEK